MGYPDEEFKHESLQDRETIVKYLTALGEGFKDGKILLGSKKKSIVFKPQGLLKLEVKARQKSDRVRLTLKFSWKDGKQTNGFDPEKLIIESVKR